MKPLFLRHQAVIKFLASGLTVLLFNLAVLFFLTDIFHIWYLLSSIIAYSLAVILNFFLQKFWVFENGGNKMAGSQFIVYVFVAVSNSAVNAIFLYLLVEYAGIHYIFSQAAITLLLAVINYFISRNFIFHD